MIKTGGEIEEDIFILVSNSTLKSMIKGKIYRKDMRPDTALTEDIVVSFVSGLPGTIETGVVNINIYVPYMNSVNGKVKDIQRCTMFEKMLNNFLISIKTNTDYKFELERAIQTHKVLALDQNFVNMKIKYERLTI